MPKENGPLSPDAATTVTPLSPNFANSVSILSNVSHEFESFTYDGRGLLPSSNPLALAVAVGGWETEEAVAVVVAVVVVPAPAEPPPVTVALLSFAAPNDAD